MSGEALLEEVAGYRVKDAVEELDRLWRGVATSHFKALVDDDRARGVGVGEHLGDGGAEKISVNDWHALQTPVLRVRLDDGVDLGLTGAGDAVEILGEATGLFVDVVAGGPEEFANFVGGLLAKIALEEHLHGEFAGLAAGAHYSASFSKKLSNSSGLSDWSGLPMGELALGGELAGDGDHLDGGDGRFEALVAGFEAGAIEGLFEGLAGEDTEGVRDAGLLLGLADAAGDFVVDGLVVGGFAAEEAAEGDDGVVLAGVGEGAGGVGDLPSAGDADDLDVA